MFFFRTKYKEKDLIITLLNQKFSYEKANKIYKSLGINLNTIKYNNQPILNICCKKDLYKSVVWLLNNNIKVNLVNNRNETAVFDAIYSNNTNILSALYSCNANFNHLNNDSRTALQESIYNSNHKIIRYLLKTTKAISNKDIDGNNILFQAINIGDYNLAKNIIELEKLDLNEMNMNGCTVMHLKNTMKNNELAMHLIKYGANPTIKDKTGKSFLSYAVLEGIKNSNIIKRASFLGFNLGLKNSNGRTILMDAARHFLLLTISKSQNIDEQAKLIKELVFLETSLNEVDDENENFFFDITRSKNVELIIYILKNIPNFNLNKFNNIGLSPLLLLIFGGLENFELIQLYILNKASLEQKNTFGKNAIEIMIDIILYKENGVQIESQYEALIQKDSNHKELFELIVKKYNINLNQLNSKNEPLFFNFIINFNPGLIKIFRHLGFNINKKDSNGDNIIFKLFSLNFKHRIKNKNVYLSLIKNLVKIGADINSVNKDNVTPLQFAIQNNCMDTINLILELNPALDTKDEKDRNLIHLCVFSNNIFYIEKLSINNKNRINEPDKYGVTPINYAAFLGKYEIVFELLRLKAVTKNNHKKAPSIIKFLKKYKKNIFILLGINKNDEYKDDLKDLVENIINEFDINKTD